MHWTGSSYKYIFISFVSGCSVFTGKPQYFKKCLGPICDPLQHLCDCRTDLMSAAALLLVPYCNMAAIATKYA